MSKRKRREALAKQDIDISIPFRFDIIGSKDDPCFGKLYDMTTSECQRCGDSEFCAIAMMARNKRKRDKIEKTQVFKDTETTDSPEEGRYKRFKEYIIKWLTIKPMGYEKLCSKYVKKTHLTAKIFDKYLTKMVNANIIHKANNKDPIK